MRPIVGLYVEMLRDMGLKTILECKRRITKADLRYYRITPEQHQVKYLYKALEHINKTSSKSELSVRENVLDLYRQKMLTDMDAQIERLPENHPFRLSLESSRKIIESQITPAPGMA